MHVIRFLLTALAATPFLLGSAVFAEASEGASEVRLTAGKPTSDGRLRAGIDIRLAPGWKTYWINPGPSGVAPRLDFSASSNLASAEPKWPAPERLDDGGTAAVGYTGRLVVPLLITAKEPGQAVVLQVKLDYGLCEKICVPAHEDLTLDLPPGAEPDAADEADLQAFEAQVPKPARMGEGGPFAVAGAGKTIAGLEVDVRFPEEAKRTDVFARAAGVSVGIPQKLQNGAWRLKLRSGPPPKVIDFVAVADAAAIQVPVTLDDLAPRP